MPPSVFLARAQTEIVRAGRSWRVPALYQRLSMMQALFTCDLNVARSLMPSKRLVPLSPCPKCGILSIACVEYNDCDIGPYNEVGIGIGVRVDGVPWIPATPYHMAKSLLSDTYHGFVCDLPVTTKVAEIGGVEIFNFPKWLAEISFSETELERKCVVKDSATNEIAYSVTGLKVPSPKTVSSTTQFRMYSHKDGMLLDTLVEMKPKKSANVWFNSGRMKAARRFATSSLSRATN